MFLGLINDYIITTIARVLILKDDTRVRDRVRIVFSVLFHLFLFTTTLCHDRLGINNLVLSRFLADFGKLKRHGPHNGIYLDSQTVQIGLVDVKDSLYLCGLFLNHVESTD